LDFVRNCGRNGVSRKFDFADIERLIPCLDQIVDLTPSLALRLALEERVVVHHVVGIDAQMLKNEVPVL
jgi:hypothetical protein